MRLFFFSAMSLVALTACGADLGDPCTTDDDCAGDLVCHAHDDGDSVCEEHDEHEDHEDDTGHEE